ncbi:MAG TPA: sulfatase-like hydrolase/transferase [Verrucomicrobiae bacterium]|nr:sulfatase-like hydrolase/transferase [Verrucomicrobiae bacterium]
MGILLHGRIACVCACLFAIVLAPGLGHCAGGNAPPNIVVILADDLGWGDLGCQGATDLRTPHVDSLASRGMRLSHFYANSPVCSPTRASLMTGRYPDLVGVPGVIRFREANSWGNLADDAVLLPAVLKGAGYHTAIVGKWHLGLASPDTPNDRGFDHFHGFLGDMMDDYWTHLRDGQNFMRLDRTTIEPEGHATDLFTRWAIEYIESRVKAGGPFFLYLAYNAPHDPIQPPPDWLARVRAREPGATEQRSKIAALIEHMDDGVGRVLAAIERLGIAGRTLVIFTSDNGGNLAFGANNGPLRGGKQQMFEGGIRVPFLAVLPGRIAAGVRSERRAITMDIFPTVCELAGAAAPTAIEGRTFLPTLLGHEQPADDRTFFWVRREGGKYKGGVYYAARRGSWKLLQNEPGEPFGLYDLDQDSGETKDLGAVHPQRAALEEAVGVHGRQGEAVPWRP